MITAHALDTAVARILTALGETEMDHEVERLVRLGACRGRGFYASHAYDAIGIAESVLAVRLSDAGLPPVRVLLMWGRIVAVMDEWAYRARQRSLHPVAVSHGWSAGYNFSDAVNGHLGMRPRDWVGMKLGLGDLAERLVVVWQEKARCDELAVTSEKGERRA